MKLLRIIVVFVLFCVACDSHDDSGKANCSDSGEANCNGPRGGEGGSAGANGGDSAADGGHPKGAAGMGDGGKGGSGKTGSGAGGHSGVGGAAAVSGNGSAGKAGSGGAASVNLADQDAGVSEAGSGADVATNFGIDAAHTNAQPGASIATPLTKKWTAQLSGPVSYPVVANGLVFVAAAESQPNVRALNVDSGAMVWGPIVVGSKVSLAYDAGRLYTLDGAGNLAALNAMNGQQLWSVKIQGQLDFMSPPVAANGWVYVNGLGSGGNTYGIDGATGKTTWTANTFDGSDGTVAVADGVVYEAEACDQVSAFNATTGARNWFFSTSCTGGGGSTPAVYEGMIWVRDWAQGNIILDLSGKSKGSFAADAPPSFGGGMVFYMKSHTLTAVDVQTNTIRWSFMEDQLCSSAAVAGQGKQVFAGSASGKLFELDEMTGQQKSSVDVGSAVSCASEAMSFAIAEGHLLVPAGNLLAVY